MIFKKDEVLKQCFVDVNASWRANQVAALMKNVVPTALIMQGSEEERIQHGMDVLSPLKRGQALSLPEKKASSFFGGSLTLFGKEPKTHVTPTTTPKPKL